MCALCFFIYWVVYFACWLLSCAIPSCSGNAVVPASPYRYQQGLQLFSFLQCDFPPRVLFVFSNNIFSIIYLHFSHFFSGYCLRLWLGGVFFFSSFCPLNIDRHAVRSLWCWSMFIYKLLYSNRWWVPAAQGPPAQVADKLSRNNYQEAWLNNKCFITN